MRTFSFHGDLQASSHGGAPRIVGLSLKSSQAPGQNLAQAPAKGLVIGYTWGWRSAVKGRWKVDAKLDSAVLCFLTNELNFCIKGHSTAFIIFLSMISGVFPSPSPWGWTKFLDLHSIRWESSYWFSVFVLCPPNICWAEKSPLLTLHRCPPRLVRSPSARQATISAGHCILLAFLGFLSFLL